jgi:LysR family transcriptional regulator, transcriptional activator of nhaA
MTRPSLTTLNYQHLLYFWVVAREGSIARATKVLHLTQPTISAQLRRLETSLGDRLFVKRGRGLVLTELGHVVYRHADALFGVGRELLDAVTRGGTDAPARFIVGISDALPKLTTYQLLAPALSLDAPYRLIFRIGKTDQLVTALALHELDLVLADQPAPAARGARTYNHLLGESGITIFGAPPLAAQYRRRFPQSLDRAPFVLPTENTALRGALEAWFIATDIRPRVVCEVEDAALLQVAGQSGLGLFAAPTVVEAQVRAQHGVRVVGRVAEVRERFYAISAERRLAHPAVVALTDAARTRLFG